MTDKPKSPTGGVLSEALNSDPRDNARRAEDLFDSPNRREQEEAMGREDESLGHTDVTSRGNAINLPPD
ncbi:hypothetical protein [Arenibaculum pallidiluteum]|uniref:hypothetical protein n=1 Tax=Arenibaculum pallidiluteum TaxID=2812559 RepID=UPI001A964210|nr:hypothetical protein [Arenibaculum pallidiluteum]